MALYRYEAVTPAGELFVGEMEAASEAEIVSRLQRQGHVPIRTGDAVSASGEAANTWLRTRLAGLVGPRRLRLSPRGLTQFTQKLATMLHAGLPLDRALEIVRDGTKEAAFRAALQSLVDQIRGGTTLADAMAAANRLFPRFLIGMIRAGEAGATLPATLLQVAAFMDKYAAARSRVVSAMIYPAMVLVSGVGMLAAMFAFVVPRFQPLFEQAGGKLPASAASLLAVSAIIHDDGALILTGVTAAVLLLFSYGRQPAGRRRLDALLLRLPAIGGAVLGVEFSRFARTLGVLLRNGVAVLPAVAIARETVTNAVIRGELSALGEQLTQGKGLSAPLSRLVHVPALAVQLIAVGEETARLDEMLIQVADILDDEAQRTADRLVAALVPVVTILLGLVVAATIGSLMSALMSVYELAA